MLRYVDSLVQPLFALCLLLVASPPLLAQESDDRLQENYELMRMFAETFEQIDQNYVKDLDRRELVEAAIRGMLERLDQYSSYIPREQMTQFNEIVEQEYGGVGIQVNVNRQTGRLTVVTPLPDTPAFHKGVRAGDVIEEIDGESTKGFRISDAVKRLKGPRGAAVTLGVRHLDSSDVEQISLVRDIIQVATVRGDKYLDGEWDFMLDDENKIGYIRLTHFSRHSAQELVEALNTLQTQGMKALILDLRDNPGGLLRQATAIADLFVDDGLIVSTKGRNVPERKWSAHREGTFGDFPMTVLVNRISASASEIVSACLQDQKRATIVGERTWGKGSVQNVINLEEGASALKLTTASYYRPSGRNIHRFPDSRENDEWGVSPDDGFAVPFTREELFTWRADRYDRDIIRAENAEPTEDDRFVDRQLQKALEFLGTTVGGKKPADAGDTASGEDAGEDAADAKSDNGN